MNLSSALTSIVLIYSCTYAYTLQSSTSFTFRHNWKCVTCAAVASVLKASYFTNRSQECLAAIVAEVCTTFNIENSRVCDAISSQYRDEVLYVVGQLLLIPKQFCGFMLENCSDAYKPLSNNWTVPLPEQDATSGPPRLRSNKTPRTIRVLHLSDIHLDTDYVVGSEVDCSYPLCCRNRSEHNGTVKRPAGKWGSQGKCDIPITLLESLFKHLRDNETFDYILWTGDIPPHNIWNQTRADQLRIYNILMKELIYYFPNKLVFSALGNHESAPADSFPPHFESLPSKYSISWLYDTLAVHWSRWVPKGSRRIIRNKASYAILLFPGLRLISINTNYCVRTNFWLYLNDTDPDQDLAWLVDQLYKAEQAGDKVHIIGHVPSGDRSCLPQWSYNYYRIIDRFSDTVTAQFFGHTHADQFAVFYEQWDYTRPATNVMYIGPSVTTYDRFMPAYRIYTIDVENGTVLDHETHYANLTEADIRGIPAWKLEYKAKDAYGMKDLSPESWSRLIKTMLSNDTVANMVIKHFYRSDANSCDRNCFLNTLCQFRSGRSHYSALCDDLTKPIKKLTLPKISIKPLFKNSIVPKECQWPPKVITEKRVKLNANCATIETECHSSECGRICQGVVDAHAIFGQPSKLDECRQAVCHISALCCCTIML